MGLELSTPNVRDDNLLFPPEVVETILEHMSTRDKLIARQACLDWQHFLDNQFSNVVVKIVDTDEPLKFLSESATNMIWTNFLFKNVQFSRCSISFWHNYGDMITSIDFYGCTFPRNHPQTNEEELQNQCRNLRHLSLRQCSQYLMMGKLYFHIHKFLSLQNLDSLDLSENPYLSDHAVLCLVQRTERLTSLNLSDCNIAFTFAVFKRFYPKVASGEDTELRDFSDNVLTFHMIHRAFFSTPKATCLREMLLNDTRVDKPALNIIMDPDSFKWESICLNRCSEVKSTDLVRFLTCQKTLRKLEIERCRLVPGDLPNIDFSSLEHLVIKGCGDLTSVDFLEKMCNLEYFDMSTCAAVQLKEEHFANCKALKVLRMRSSIPFYMLNENNSPVSPILVNIFKHVNNLRELDVGCCGGTISDEVMQGIIRYLPLLEVLKVCKSKITDRGLAGIEIDEFDSRLSSHIISNRRANILARNCNLPRGLCISRLYRLKELSLAYCLDLSEATWNTALRLPNLVKLDISGCSQISVKGFQSVITTCSNLETLIIVQCGTHVTSDPVIIDEIRRKLYRLRHLIL